MCIVIVGSFNKDFPGGSDSKASACNAEDPGLIPGSGRSPGVGTGNPLQYSCLEDPMDGRAWQAKVHGVAELDTTEGFHFNITIATDISDCGSGDVLNSLCSCI